MNAQERRFIPTLSSPDAAGIVAGCPEWLWKRYFLAILFGRRCCRRLGRRLGKRLRRQGANPTARWPKTNAILFMMRRPTFFSPRSILPIYVRSTPTFSARKAWVQPRLSRSSLTRRPNSSNTGSFFRSLAIAGNFCGQMAISRRTITSILRCTEIGAKRRLEHFCISTAALS